MTEYDPKLKWVYRILASAIGPIFILALLSDFFRGVSDMPVTRLVGLILIGIEALVWAWLTDRSWR